MPGGAGRGGGPLYNGLYREVPAKMSNFFRLQVYKRLGILLVEVYKQVKKYVILVCKKAHNDMHFMAVRKGENILLLRFIHIKKTVNLQQLKGKLSSRLSI